MTREKMLKTKWVPFMIVEYRPARATIGYACDCILLSIDFENELVTLSPLREGMYRPVDFDTSISNIELPIRAASKNGKEILNQKIEEKNYETPEDEFPTAS